MELGEGPKMSFALLDRSTRDTMFQLRSDSFPPLSTFPIILIMIDGPQGFSWSQCFLSRLLCGMFLDLGKLIYKPPPSTLQITQQAFDRVGGDLKFCLSRVLRWEFFFWSPPSKKKLFLHQWQWLHKNSLMSLLGECCSTSIFFAIPQKFVSSNVYFLQKYILILPQELIFFPNPHKSQCFEILLGYRCLCCLLLFAP